MFIEPDDKDTSAIGHEGQQYEADAKGRFDVPAELGLWLTARPGWSVSEDDEPVKTKPAPAKAPARKPAAKAADK